jgi:queuine/archaeosine tRNA-ribosyltransferase
LHLLGTGNPTSIALYSWAGADSFDGLEWCQTAVDHDTGQLFHLSQSDFFRKQTAWGDEDISFHSRTLAHNLTFYADWMQRLRQAVYDDNVINFCRLNFSPRIFRQCAVAFKWEVAE